MSLISVNNLTFGYDGSYNNVFEDVSFNIDTDWKLGLIGRNGKGKTTFLRLLLGKYEYKGTISKNVDVDYFPFEVTNKNRMSIEIVNEIAPNANDWEIIKELNLLNSDIEILYRNFNLLSGGEQIKILLISLFLKGNNFLLIDEPTNHLDIPTLGWLESFIKSYTGSVILISHDRYFLDRTVNKIFAIADGKIKTYFGNYSQYVEALALELEAQEQAYVTQQKKISDMEETIRKNRAWGAQSSEKAYRVAKQLERRIDEMDKVEKPKGTKDIALSFTQESRSGNDVLTIRDLTFAYGEDIILCGADMELDYQDKVCLIGKNGTGKSTVLKIVLGELTDYDGEVILGSNVKIGYLPQNVSFENEDITILDEFKKHFVGSLTKVYSTLAAFHFFGEEVNKRISSLSGGEKVRLKFA